ncbi:hypothetical protein LCGC14_2503810, partial [marine sediment metagenome]
MMRISRIGSLAVVAALCAAAAPALGQAGKDLPLDVLVARVTKALA